MKNTIALYLIALGVAVIALQNAGIIPPLKTAKTRIEGTVPVKGLVDVGNPVSVQGLVDVNLSEIVGRQLVESTRGMYIGVNSVSNTIIPIHWGEMSVDVDNTVDVAVESVSPAVTVDVDVQSVTPTVDVEVQNAAPWEVEIVR